MFIYRLHFNNNLPKEIFQIISYLENSEICKKKKKITWN